MAIKNKTTISLEEATEWYSSNRYLYKQLANKVHIIISELLELNKISVHAIFNRAKKVDSFKEKIKDQKKYDNPQEQITDLSGIRIICYVESDIDKICKVIEQNFNIDAENSGDKSKLLGTDKVGYKSVHYVGKLNESRLLLPEYQNYRNRAFEIQIRTILQHAWAEIEHDRNYKFAGELPEEIQRRFKLVAGSLELADKEFDRIASEIDKISFEVEKGTKEGNLNFDINSTTIKQFLSTKFALLIPENLAPVFPSIESETEVLQEINDYGLKSLDDLNKIIKPDFDNKIKMLERNPSFLGLLRLILIVNDWKKYFKNSYKNNYMTKSLKDNKVLINYNIPIDEIIDKYPYIKKE